MFPCTPLVYSLGALCSFSSIYYFYRSKKKIVDYFKVLLLYFVITRLVVLVSIYVLIYWQFDEMFGNYMFSI